MIDEEIKLKQDINYKKLKKNLDSFREKFKYVLFSVKVLGNFVMMYFFLRKNWFNAFIFYVIFFPQEVNIVKFFKRVGKRELRNKK